MARLFSIRESVHAHLASLAKVQDAVPIIERITETIASTLAAGGKIMTCGNGGSAAEALHFAEEMIGRFSKDRRPLAALCLSADPTALTCIANDYGFEQVFARQVDGLGLKNDTLVILSTSGKSPNILRALERARAIGLKTVGLLGPPGSSAEPLCDVPFTVAVPHNAHTQELHLMVIHLVLEQLDDLLSH